MFLVAVLLAGLVPCAFADEAMPTGEVEASEAATEAVEETTAPPETAVPSESTEPPSETTEPPEATETTESETEVTEPEILSKVNSEIRGLYNFYSIACNVSTLNKFSSIMKYSMLKTLQKELNSED